MNIEIAVSEVSRTPAAFLSSECALALGAFLYGYKSADGSASAVLQELTCGFDIPNQATACEWAYLMSSDSGTAFRRVIAALLGILRRDGVPVPVDGWLVDLSLVGTVKDAILQGRPGMVLGEPTVVWMHDYFQGFLVGLSAVRPAEASRQTQMLTEFESWLRSFHGGLQAPWYAVIRAHYGMCEYGLRRFLELWDKFELQRVAPTP